MRHARPLSILLLLALVVLITAGASSCDTSTGGSSEGKGAGATVATFTVLGTDTTEDIDITYGTDSSNYDWPMHRFGSVTLPVEKNALYYAVTAQLGERGNITCKVQIGDAVRIGHARGSYNICSAQLNRDFNGGWG